MRILATLFTGLALMASLSACAPNKQAAANLDAATAFMTKNAKAKGIKTLPSGV